MTTSAKKLSETQLAALRVGASRRSLLVSCGDRYPTAPQTLRSLRKLGLVEFKGAKGYTYSAMANGGSQTQYKVTETGRAALFESGDWTVDAS